MWCRPELPVDAEGGDLPVAPAPRTPRRIARRDDLPRLLQDIALEVVGRHREQPGLVVVLVELAEQVLLPRRARRWQVGLPAVAVDRAARAASALVRRRRAPTAGSGGSAVVGVQDQRALAVAPFDHVARGVQDRAPQAGIDAVDAQGAVGEIVDVAERHPPQRVGDGQQVAADVVGGAGDVPVGVGIGAVARDGFDRAAQGIDARCWPACSSGAW